MDRPTRTRVVAAAGILGGIVVVALVWLAAQRGDGSSPPPPAPGAPASTVVHTGPVTIQGRVVDDATGAGVARAIVIVLLPGVTSRGWMEARGAEATAALMQATVVTDSVGMYEIPDLARGESYTVMVTAEGYAPAIFEGGLEVTRRDPPVTTMRDVVLSAR